jgi:alpha-ketoglutarate-dependent taurine dioxygenase
MEREQIKSEGLKLGRRKAVSLAAADLIKTEYLQHGSALPLVVKPAVREIDLIAWAARNREFIETNLLKHGGVLLRNFDLKTVEQFEQLIQTLGGELLTYTERSSPRSRVSDHVYTSTDYPATQSIFLHNENSYQHVWPMRIFFYCAMPAQAGGETPIADCRRVFARIDPQIRERFRQKGWMYVRNFGDGFGLPWQTVFQTTERAAVEEHCRKNGIEVEWKDVDRLRTRAIRPAIARHPQTGETVWFNHATFFHISTLEPTIRAALLAEFKEDELPTNTYYGDGAPIEMSVLDELREAYRRETVQFPWEAGDALLLDNMLVAHGRAPFVGSRKILVGMADPFSDRETFVEK